MDLADAFQIVLDLARPSILTDEQVGNDEYLAKVKAQQEDACDTVEDFVVNHLGDD